LKCLVTQAHTPTFSEACTFPVLVNTRYRVWKARSDKQKEQQASQRSIHLHAYYFYARTRARTEGRANVNLWLPRSPTNCACVEIHTYVI